MTSDPAKIARLEEWMHDKEGENCEFKEWKTKGDFEELVRYCVALANEGGRAVHHRGDGQAPAGVWSAPSLPATRSKPANRSASASPWLSTSSSFNTPMVGCWSSTSRLARSGMAIQYDGRHWMRDEGQPRCRCRANGSGKSLRRAGTISLPTSAPASRWPTSTPRPSRISVSVG